MVKIDFGKHLPGLLAIIVFVFWGCSVEETDVESPEYMEMNVLWSLGDIAGHYRGVWSINESPVSDESMLTVGMEELMFEQMPDRALLDTLNNSPLVRQQSLRYELLDGSEKDESQHVSYCLPFSMMGYSMGKSSRTDYLALSADNFQFYVAQVGKTSQPSLVTVCVSRNEAVMSVTSLTRSQLQLNVILHIERLLLDGQEVRSYASPVSFIFTSTRKTNE